MEVGLAAAAEREEASAVVPEPGEDSAEEPAVEREED